MKLAKNLVTKEDLNKTRVNLEVKIDASEERILKRFKELEDKMAAYASEILGEIKALREEEMISTHFYRDHEKRIIRLEKQAEITP